MEKNEIPEEVTITPVIRDIERLFGRFFNSIGRLIKTIFKGIGDFFFFALKNFILLLVVTLLGGFLGIFSTKLIPRKYASSMVVKLNVDAKNQLMNDVGYINALIDRGADSELAEILQLSEAEAATLTKCEIYAFATYAEKVEAINELYRKSDTALYRDLNLGQLMASGDAELSARFKITIQASDQTIFAKIEKPLLAYFERVPELNKMLEYNRKALVYQRNVYTNEMEKLDTLARVMNIAMIERAKTSGNSGSNTYISWDKEEKNGDVNRLDLQDRYIFYAQNITKIDQELEEHNSCYFVNAHLTPYGQKIGYGRLYRGIILAVFFFLVTSLVLLIRQLYQKRKA